LKSFTSGFGLNRNPSSATIISKDNKADDEADEYKFPIKIQKKGKTY